MKRGFTIVELMMVIGIISVLITLITTAASQSVKAGRERRAQALCSVVQTGLATYYAQKAKWPEPLGGKVENGSLKQGNDEGKSGTTDADKYVLSGSEVKQMVLALVNETKAGNPIIDVSGLFVSRTSGEPGTKGYGLDFMSAVRGTKKSPKKMMSSEMYFGYQEKEHGWFRRFKMVYSIPSDQLSVSMQ